MLLGYLPTSPIEVEVEVEWLKSKPKVRSRRAHGTRLRLSQEHLSHFVSDL
jgi:hypothetical protein